MAGLEKMIGVAIRTERIARDMTQQQLAASAGMHPMALSKIERGTQKDVGINTLSKIAVALSAGGDSITLTQLIMIAEQWSKKFDQNQSASASASSLTATIALSTVRCKTETT